MSTQSKEITGLLAVIGSGAIFGFLLVGYFIYFFGPTGQYTLQNVLVSPGTLRTLDAGHDYMFDRVEYEGKPLELSSYDRFYMKVKADRSLSALEERVEALFNRGAPSRLVVWMKRKNGRVEPIQEVQLAGDYYRVELREETAAKNWVYFLHPGAQALLN